MMTERELLSRARFGISTLDEDVVIPALCEVLADNGFHDAARMLTIMECDYARQIESLNSEIEENETSIENLQEKVAELEKKLKKEPA